MTPWIQHFVYPLAPVLAMIAGGTTLIATECVPNIPMRQVKYGIALLFAAASVVLTFALWQAWPSLAGAGLSTDSASAWLVGFTRTYRLDSASLGFFAAIGVFTFISLVLMNLQFSRSDVRTEIFALTLFIASGMMVLVSANSLLMIFLGLELLSLPTYVLVGMRRRDRNSCEAALKYFLFGSFATVILVFGIALLYARFGTLSLPAMGSAIADLAASPNADTKLVIAGLSLLIISIGFKVGLVPFHMWLPDAYQGAPSTVTAFMGSAVKLAGFGLAIRIFWGLFLPIAGQWTGLLSALAVATMFLGNMAAIAQDNLKRMFAYSSISHAGFLMLGVTMLPQSGPSLSALYYYLVVYGLMFLGLFGILALIERSTKSTEIYQISGMGFTHPVLALCLALFSLSGAGIPPTAGFFAKYFVFMQAVRAGQTGLVVLALLSSLIGVYYYLRVVVYLYMKESKERLRLGASQEKLVVFCIVVCALSLLFFAVSPGALALTETFAR